MNLNRKAISSDGFESDGLDPKPKDWITLGDPDPKFHRKKKSFFFFLTDKRGLYKLLF